MIKIDYSISIAIPVFNSPHCLRDLFVTLENNSNPSLLTEIILGDDASDNFTKLLIQDIIKKSKFKIRIINQDKNIGYLNNANQLYAEAQTDIVVFLNTDTLVPPYWLERILSAFKFNKDIVLATPFSTNASNLTILPNHGQSWLEVDHCLSLNNPQYPDAHTAVGFCLSIQKNTLNEKILFDEEYKLGYWEETDLHYRVLHKGFRSIVVDNLLVYHAHGSSSFSLKHNLAEISDANKSIFYKKWGCLHEKSNKIYHEQKPYNNFRFVDDRFIFERRDLSIDILFCLPGFISKSGGINTVIEIVSYCILNRIKASIFSYGFVDNSFVDFLGLINPWRSIDEIKNRVSSIKIVCATSYDSVDYVKEIAEYYDSKIIYFVQGPESFFNSGRYFSKIIIDYLNSQLQIICVSKFLNCYLENIKVNNSTYIPLGADTHKFYFFENKIPRNMKSIAACLRNSDAKGTGSMLHSLLLAKQAGFVIHFFGKDSDLFFLSNDFGINHGDLSPTELNKLFNSVGFYMDFSCFEGLGLLPLEAASCGAIPILKYNGASDTIFVDEESAFFVTTAFADKDFFEKISKKNIDNIRSRSLKISDNLSLQKAREVFLEKIKILIYNGETHQENIKNKPVMIDKKFINHGNKWHYRLLKFIYNKNKIAIHYLWDKLIKKASEKIIFRMDDLESKIIFQKKLLEKIDKKLDDLQGSIEGK